MITPRNAYDFDALHPVANSNARHDQSALLNQLRERALASVDDPNTTLAWSSCADPAQTIRAPSAFTDHEPENRFAQKVCDSMPGFDSQEPPGKSNWLRSAAG